MFRRSHLEQLLFRQSFDSRTCLRTSVTQTSVWIDNGPCSREAGACCERPITWLAPEGARVDEHRLALSGGVHSAQSARPQRIDVRG